MPIILKRLLLLVLVLLLALFLVPVWIIFTSTDGSLTGAKMLLSGVVGYGVDSPEDSTLEQQLVLAEGFDISLYAGNLGYIRFMALSEQGDLLVSRLRQGEVLLLRRDDNGDGLPDDEQVLMSGLNKPHGLALHEGWLYIGETDAIGRIQFDSEAGEVWGEYQRLVTLDGSGNHWTKSIGFGPDGWLYISSGSSCNVCEEVNPRRAAMLRMQPDGSDLQVYASGLRNSVGFDWAPWNQSLYATDNGRDFLGDDFPPCELNKIVEGGFYGWPYINGDGSLDPDYGEGKEALLATSLSPAFSFRAHNAPLGMRFLQHSPSPQYQRSALVALHGSWNRSERDGYKVVALHWQTDGSIQSSDFLTGFSSADNVIGRPVDIVEATDGSIFVSDDYSGSIYKITYRSGKESVAVRAQPSLMAKKQASPEVREVVLSAAEKNRLQREGEVLYRQYRCGNCHDKARATAARPTRVLENLASKYSLESLAEMFTAPTPPMPVYPLDEQQRGALAVYLYDR